MNCVLLRAGIVLGSCWLPAVAVCGAETRAPGVTAATPLPQEAVAEAGAAFRLPAVADRMVDRSEFDSARSSFREVLESGKFALDEQKEALIGLARLYRKQGALAKAAAIYEKYLREFPNDDRGPWVMLQLGRTLRAIGTHSLALTRFYAVINSALQLNRDALSDYQVLARTAQFEIAETHFVMGNFAEAARFFAKVRLLELAPEDRARAHFKTGYALHLNQDFEAAARVLGEFVASCPQDENTAEAYFLLASTCWKMNRREDALAATLRLLQAEQPARPGEESKRWAYWQRRAGNQLANDCFQVGEYQSALQLYRRLADLSPEPEWRLSALYQAALCHERLRAGKAAADLYHQIREVAAKAPTSAALAELARMAAWRLEHFGWQEEVAQKTAAFFSTQTSTPAPLERQIKRDDPSRSAQPASVGL